MDLPNRVDRNLTKWRIVYQLFSGLLFMTLGVVIFVRAKGYMNFLSAGLFGCVLAAYGVYRLVMFLRSFKQRREGRDE